LWGLGARFAYIVADLVLLRRAIREEWPVAADVRQAIVDELGEGLESHDARRTISIARTFIAMDRANMRADDREQRGGTRSNERTKRIGSQHR